MRDREPDVVHPDLVIARLAARQRGVVERGQLLAAGLTKRQIDHRVATGRLHPIHRGVYLVGHPQPQPLARETAALLAYGPRAALSHDTAAWRWGVEHLEPEIVTLTVVGAERRRRSARVRLHTTGSLERADVRRRDDLLMTSPARTLLDLAAIRDPRRLARAVEQAQVLGLVTPRELNSLMARLPGRRGAKQLRRILEANAAPSFTRSEAERRMLALVRAAQLPAPQANARLHGYEVDLLWRAQRLVIEIDGFAFHCTRAAFERDRRRDAALQAKGVRVLRVTWRQIEDEPHALLARVAQALVAGDTQLAS